MTDTIEEVGRYKVDTFIDPDKLVSDAVLEGANINDTFITQSGLMAYYGMLAARAAGQAARFKLRRDAVKAKVASAFRTAAADGNGKMTENALSEKVEKDPRVLEILEAYALAIQVEAETKAAVEALRHRKDMIVQLGVAERDEQKGELRMKIVSGVTSRGAELKAKLAKSKA